METEPLTPSALREAVGISQSYASMILSGERKPAAALAIQIFRKTGRKFGPITNMSAEDIDQLERLQGLAA